MTRGQAEREMSDRSKCSVKQLNLSSVLEYHMEVRVSLVSGREQEREQTEQ